MLYADIRRRLVKEVDEFERVRKLQAEWICMRIRRRWSEKASSQNRMETSEQDESESVFRRVRIFNGN